MSRFSGRCGRGAQQRARTLRREEAIARNAAAAERRSFDAQRALVRERLDELELARLRDALTPKEPVG